MKITIYVNKTPISLDVDIELDRNINASEHPCDACIVSKYKDDCKGIEDCCIRNIHYVEKIKKQ